MKFPRALLAGLALAALAADPPDPAVLAKKLDGLIDAKLAEKHLKPTPLADDAAFLRRTSLDLIGRIPTVREVHDFLADSHADKRKLLVERLLSSPGYVNHFGGQLSKLLVPEADTNQFISFSIDQFDIWLKRQVRANMPYDQLVRELLTPKLPTGRQRTEYFNYREGQGLFLASKEMKPENLAAATARVFLGVRLECAQCHDHPFARWSREQFWSMAGFFAGIERNGGDNAFFGPVRETLDRREMQIPNTERVVQAGFLDGSEPKWRADGSSRDVLAEWVTSPDNPFFARTAANRIWGQLFGNGVVEPVDDFHDENPPSHPEVLDELAKAFVQSGFDFKYLFRAITQTKAYQRQSAGVNASDVRLLAGVPTKVLSGEQIFDSLVLATGLRDTSSPNDRRFFGFTSPRAEYAKKFAINGKQTESPTTILQALTLMNGTYVNEATSMEGSETLTALIESPFLDDSGRLEALFLATLSRKPSVTERDKLLKYLGSAGASRERLADVFWALLNSAEFRLNH